MLVLTLVGAAGCTRERDNPWDPRVNGGPGQDSGAHDSAVQLDGLISDSRAKDGPKPDTPLADLTSIDLPGPDHTSVDLTADDQQAPDLPRMDQFVPDQALPDATKPDLQQPDLQQPDLAIPDLPVPDQLVPDLALPDLMTPDMRPPCTHPPVTKSCTKDKHGIEWCAIPAGCYKMGAPAGETCRISTEVQHEVTLTKKFEIQSTETTQDQFKKLMNSSPSHYSSCGGTCPVEMVTWDVAASFCNALSKSAGYKECYSCSTTSGLFSCKDAPSYAYSKIYQCPGYRLPTDAEWEYACRAGTTGATYLGAIKICIGADSVADKVSWYAWNALMSTHPAGKKAVNAWGLYDMLGNVFEWCHDWFSKKSAAPVTDPWGSMSGANRMLRGGSISNGPQYLRAAARRDFPPSSARSSFGFRCVRTTK